MSHTHKTSNSELKLPNPPGRAKNTNRLELTHFIYLQRTHKLLEQSHLLLLCEEDGTPWKGQKDAKALTTGAGYSTVKIQHHQRQPGCYTACCEPKGHITSVSQEHDISVMETVVTFDSFPQHTSSLQKGGNNTLLLLVLEIWTWKDRQEEFNWVLLLLGYSRGCTTKWAGRTTPSRGEKRENSQSTTLTPACSNVSTVTKLLASSFSCCGNKCSPSWRKRYKIV